MNTDNSIDEWIKYLERTKKPIREGDEHKLYREVGKAYGLTEEQMDNIAKGEA